MKRKLKTIFDKLGIEINRRQFNLDIDGFVTLKPNGPSIGNVLLAYILEPFLLTPGEKIPNTHTHFWESTQIAQTFLDMGYSVDVISYRNKIFKPEKKYDFFISARTNFQRIAEALDNNCVKIAHLDMSHWLFNNTAALMRCLDIQKRRKVTLRSYKMQEENLAIEYSDYAVVLGNKHTLETYSYAGKKMFPIHIPSCLTFPSPENKIFSNINKTFLWFGSKGMVHKGLDLALEAFKQLPECTLYVCGPVEKEKDFVDAYFDELYRTDNIKTIGWVDVEAPSFYELTNKCVGLIYPSCAEGQAGAVATCMQVGLIPVISYESGINVEDFGVILKENTIDEIIKSINYVTRLSNKQLREMAYASWKYANIHNTRKAYTRNYKKVIEDIVHTESSKK